MRLNRPLLAAGYLTAALLVLVPFSEAALSVWPARVTEATWRFGATGLLSRALMTPLLGAFLAAALAAGRGHRRILWTLTVLGGAAALLLALLVPLFVLDVLEMRSRVRSEAAVAFDSASVIALSKILATALVSGLLSVGCGRAAREAARSASSRRVPIVSPSGGVRAG